LIFTRYDCFMDKGMRIDAMLEVLANYIESSLQTSI